MVGESEEERAERRERNRKKTKPEAPSTEQPKQSYGYSTDLGKYADPNYAYQEGDEMSGPGPEPPRDSPEWANWKAHAKAWRAHIGQRQSWVDMMLGMGNSLDDLGIRDVKEEGQAGYRRRALMGDQGMVNQGWEYDWAGGKKRNMITSDVTARERWIPIQPQEYKERQYAQSYGGGVQGYVNRLQSEQQNRFGNVMAEGGPGNGIVRNSYGVYQDARPDGSTNYYDSYGARTNMQGARTRGSYHYDGRGQQVVNRAAGQLDAEGAPNRYAPNPTFTGNVGRTFGNPGVPQSAPIQNMTPQPTYSTMPQQPRKRPVRRQSYYGTPERLY